MFLKFGKLYNCQPYNYDGVQIDKPEHIWKSPEILQSLEGLNIVKSHDDNTIIGRIDRVFTRWADLGVFTLLCFEDEYSGLINADTGLSLEYTSPKSINDNGDLSFVAPQFIALALTDNPRGINTYILTDSSEEVAKVRDTGELESIGVVAPSNTNHDAPVAPVENVPEASASETQAESTAPTGSTEEVKEPIVEAAPDSLPELPTTANPEFTMVLDGLKQQIKEMQDALNEKFAKLESPTPAPTPQVSTTVLVPVPNQTKPAKREVFKKW